MKAGPIRAVLILDDDPEDAYITRRLLMRGGIKNPIVMVDCGEQARAFLRAASYGSAAPCAFFLDIKMDGENGFHVLEWAREQQSLRDTAIFVMSGSNHPADKTHAKELGATDYFVKYPTADALAKCVRDSCN